MHTRAFPYIGLLSLFWGTNIVASRYGIGEFNPYLFIALRLTFASLVFLPILLISGRRWPMDRAFWRYAPLSGLLGVAVPMTTFILSLQYQSSGVASIFVTMGPVFIVIAAHFFLPDEQMSLNKGLGILLALAGSLFLILRGESGLAGVGRASPLGFGLVMVGLFSESINTVLVRRRMGEMDTMVVTGIRLVVGALITLSVALLVGRFSLVGISPAGYFSLGYASLVGALGGQFLAFYLMRHHGATAFSLTSYIVPVVAMLFGVLALGEIITWGMLLGIVFIAGGIFLVNRRTYPLA